MQLKRRREDQRSPKISLEEGKPDPVTTEVVQSAEIRQRWF